MDKVGIVLVMTFFMLERSFARSVTEDSPVPAGVEVVLVVFVTGTKKLNKKRLFTP